MGRLVEIPGVFSQGETLDELKGNIRDAHRMLIDAEPLDFLPEKTELVLETRRAECFDDLL